MPAHDEALNDRSLMPPVSVTMQPRVLVPVAAAVFVDVLVGLLVGLLVGAEVVLLPHAAVTSVVDTASATTAHALCFTLTSTGPARRRAWPRIRPRLSRRLCLAAPAWEGERRLSGLLVAESEPDHDGIPGWPDIHPGVRSADFGTFLQAESGLRGGGAAGRGRARRAARRRRGTGEVERDRQPAAGRLGQAGGAAVGGDQPVHDGQAQPCAAGAHGGEPQEGALAVLGAHARAVVADGDPGTGRRGRGGERDLVARAERVQGVGDQVVQDLLQVPFAD